jgi:hypothetical protein
MSGSELMYYDLIASLPYLPHFEQAQRLPVTQLRLNQRLRQLRPDHAEQLNRALLVVRWRSGRLLDLSDAAHRAHYLLAVNPPLDTALREYIAFRIDQQTLLAAVRRKQAGIGLPDGSNTWGVGPLAYFIRRHWDAPDFGLTHVHPWFSQARDLLAAGDARGLERLLMRLAWRWLGRCAEQDVFGFRAVFSYVFRWDMLRAWLACDADLAKSRFKGLVDKVTHVQHD